MANEYNCGGGWTVSGGAQEEYVMRSSTLSLALWNHRRFDQDKKRPWPVGTDLLGRPEAWYRFPIVEASIRPEWRSLLSTMNH